MAGRLQDDHFDVHRVAGTQALVDHPLAETAELTAHVLQAPMDGVVLAVEAGAPLRSNDLIEAARWARTHQLWEPMRAVFERAWDDVPGPETGLWFGEALYWTRRMPEAEAVLGAGELVCITDAERVALATMRARTLEIGLARPSEARALRQSRLDSVSDPAARPEMECAQCER